MKAVVYTNYGAPDVLKLTAIPKPAPKDNEVLIKVHTATVSSSDCNARNFVFVPRGFGLLARLMMGLRKPKHPVLGVEFAGEVEAIGTAVTKFNVGDQVFGLDGMQMGAYAEYKVVREAAGMALKPADMPYEEAVAIPNGALTAYTFLKHKGNIQRGQKVLIIGASGSIGTFAVQLAKYFGADVTGVCSTRNVDLVKSLGADHVIDYMREDYLHNGRYYDLIFDTVGATTFAGCKQSLTKKGVYLPAAGGSREMRQMLVTSLFGSKKVKMGPSSESADDLRVLKDLAEAGLIKPVIDRCYPLEEIADAHRYVDSGRKKGNVVITVA